MLQLEVYLQAEIQFEAQIDEGTNPGEIAALSAPKKRVEHAVQLARRVIEVEKARVALFEENERLKGEIDGLRGELETSKKQVEQVQSKLCESLHCRHSLQTLTHFISE